MEKPRIPWVSPFIHVDIKNRCTQCDARVRRWALSVGIDPFFVVAKSRGPHETPIRVVVERCDQLRARGD